MNKVYCMTLAHNLPSEVEKATKELYDMNGDVHHVIVDLSFPLFEPDKIPLNITRQRLENSSILKYIADKYNSTYIKLDNIGVSQNWTQAMEFINPDDSDLVIGADPDERVQNAGWVEAMGKVCEAGYDLISLGQTELEDCLEKGQTFGAKITDKEVNGVRIHEVQGALNMALIGISGRLFKRMGGQMPYPTKASRYGWIEGAIMQFIDKWAILPDYRVLHTLSSPLYGEWKLFITSRPELWDTFGQPDFGTWLRWKRAGILP